jgi:drug/metabolite transporter (DMT)-like permease
MISILTAFSLDRMKTLAWMVCWAVSFNCAMSLVKLLKTSDTGTVIFLRFMFSLSILAVPLLKQPLAQMKTEKGCLHFFNALFRCAAVFCSYYAYAHLPLTCAASIGFTAPFIAVVLALFLLKERVQLYKWAAVVIGYAGVLVMINPQEIMLNMAIAVSLLANLFAGLASVTTKALSKTDSDLQIMVYSNAISLILIGSVLLFTWKTPDLTDWPLLALIGAFGTFSQYFFIQALRISDVSYVAPYEYIRLLFAVPIGLLVFNEIPSFLSAIGSLIIVGSSFFLTYMELRESKIKNLAPIVG